MKNTKKSLLTSALCLLLCMSMLVGTTFAWFTDEVTSGKNQIIAGNLDVELEYAKVVNGQIAAWAPVAGETEIFDPNALWEPGHTEVVYLKVSNLGTLELKYQLGVNVISETPSINVNDEAFKLSEHLVFKAVELPDALTTYSDREVAQLTAGTEKGLKDYNGKTTKLEVGGEDYVALIVYMPETVGNEANYKTGAAVPTIELGINLFATQKDAESDSFGPDYDEDAWNPGMKVYGAQDLQAAINNGIKNIELMADIQANETIIIPQGAEVELNLNGKTLTGTMHKNDGAVINNKGNLILKNGTVSSTANNGGSAIMNSGNAVLEEVTLNGAPNADGSWPSYTVNNTGVMTATDTKITSYHGAVASYGEGAIVTLNNSEIDMAGIPGFTSHGIYTYNNGAVVVNGGEYANKATDQNATGASVINGAVTINGGTFSGRIENYYGTPVIKGGTFSVDPTRFVAAGYKNVAADGSYYVVANNVAGVVTKPETLKDALSAAGAAGAGNTTIAFFGNIDMSGTAWTPIKVDGYHGADIVTIEGNGATITGLTAPLFAGGFAGGSGIVIKDLTIADSNIVSTNTIGSGAFIESVDSMALITLDNCHLVNSTVTGGSGSRTGGLIGWTAGYNNVNDGPVKTYVNITNCSVIDCTITCDGSVGGIYGHAGNNAWTYSTIENCTVKNCKLNSTDDGGWRVGVVVGTANVGEVTISNITESGNTLTQTGKTAPAGQSNLYGRFVPGTTGKLEIDGKTAAADTAGVNNALNNGEDVVLMDDVKVLATEVGSNGYGATGVKVSGSTLDGNGNSLGVDAWGTWDSAINISGGTIKNLKVNCGMRGIFMGSATADVYIDNVTIDGTIYTFNSDGGSKEYGVYISNSTLNGWTSHSDVHKEVVYTNCEFGEGQGYAFCRPYGPTKFIGCNFSEGFTVDPIGAVVFENCTINGVALTAENVATLVTNTANATVK